MSKYIVCALLNTIAICDDNVLGNKNIKVFNSKKECNKAIKEIKNKNEIAKSLNFYIVEVLENE